MLRVLFALPIKISGYAPAQCNVKSWTVI